MHHPIYINDPCVPDMCVEMPLIVTLHMFEQYVEQGCRNPCPNIKNICADPRLYVDVRSIMLSNQTL